MDASFFGLGLCAMIPAARSDPVGTLRELAKPRGCPPKILLCKSRALQEKSGLVLFDHYWT